jgi:hypothetical protein
MIWPMFLVHQKLTARRESTRSEEEASQQELDT